MAYLDEPHWKLSSYILLPLFWQYLGLETSTKTPYILNYGYSLFANTPPQVQSTKAQNHWAWFRSENQVPTLGVVDGVMPTSTCNWSIIFKNV